MMQWQHAFLWLGSAAVVAVPHQSWEREWYSDSRHKCSYCRIDIAFVVTSSDRGGRIVVLGYPYFLPLVKLASCIKRQLLQY
ncbi:hypothetical protein GGR57DRAFT_456280 [Xylariaceae sp. FL1272]|nr:hypothetical protein GGR57DRAFT_456280 [Xylariaceae sp. FL1272]